MTTELESLWADARAEMDSHGLTDWQLVYSATRGAALGTTCHGTRTITLSAPHMESGTREQGWDTVLHEIAHALCDVEAKHGPVWKATARRLGANPSSVAHSAPSKASDYPVIGVCPSGHAYGRSRMPSRASVYTCRRGCGYIVWKRNIDAVTDTVRAAVDKYGRTKVKALLPVGAEFRINMPTVAKWHGRNGVVVKAGRTKYTARVAAYPQLVAIPAACVEPV